MRRAPQRVYFRLRPTRALDACDEVGRRRREGRRRMGESDRSLDRYATRRACSVTGAGARHDSTGRQWTTTAAS